jgi:transcriptional regulator with XRE-family HTH domain
MDSLEHMSDRDDGYLLDYLQAGPTALRMLVGAQLRRLRESRGVTREEAADVIRASHSKISRLELGRNGFKRRDVADLLTHYGVTDDADRATLLTLAGQANAPGWWQPYADAVPSWFEPYLGLEHAARVIRTYEVQYIPGLLQTESYARAVIELGHEGAPPEEVDQRVSLRMRRQRLLRESDPPYVWAVIDEAALRRAFGSAATMRAQISNLIDASQQPHVTVQVLPFSAAGQATGCGPFTILRLREPALPDVVYVEQLTSAVYPDKAADIRCYWHAMNKLVTEATQPDEAAAVLHRILKET